MYLYTSFDYLCNEPFYLDRIGYFRCPTLKDIRMKSYLFFRVLLNLIISSKEELLEQQMSTLLSREADIDNIKKMSKFDFLIYLDKDMLLESISFFSCNKVEFQDNMYVIFDTDEGNKCVLYGYINNDNFEIFCNEIKKILGLSQENQIEPKFKNNTAKKLFDKMKKHSKEQKKKQDENYTLDNMIKKYCTHNKVGINILNVWDMTYYQFISMFNEYCNGRQCDFNDMMAANTFSYNKSTDYKPLDYIKKLNNN